MDAYLDIAATVLRAEKRPLSSRAILAEAHRTGLVPPNLHGKTQHKTLSARISEDIVNRRERSRFFRTEPGRYFLREFLNDLSLPGGYRQPFPTRRRARELARGPALAIDRDLLREVKGGEREVSAAKILKLLRGCRRTYLDPKTVLDAIFVRSFVCVCRGSKVLSYRQGRYREDRDSFLHKRSIGFSALVHIDEDTLFSADDFGIVDAGVNAVKVDLDIPPAPTSAAELLGGAVLHSFIWVTRADGGGDLLAVISYKCPHWFEPVKRRLALNDLRWVDASGVNDVDDYDPWSKCVLETHRRSRIFACSQRA